MNKDNRNIYNGYILREAGGYDVDREIEQESHRKKIEALGDAYRLAYDAVLMNTDDNRAPGLKKALAKAKGELSAAKGQADTSPQPSVDADPSSPVPGSPDPSVDAAPGPPAMAAPPPPSSIPASPASRFARRREIGVLPPHGDPAVIDKFDKLMRKDNVDFAPLYEPQKPGTAPVEPADTKPTSTPNKSNTRTSQQGKGGPSTLPQKSGVDPNKALAIKNARSLAQQRTSKIRSKPSTGAPTAPPTPAAPPTSTAPPTPAAPPTTVPPTTVVPPTTTVSPAGTNTSVSPPKGTVNNPIIGANVPVGKTKNPKLAPWSAKAQDARAEAEMSGKGADVVSDDDYAAQQAWKNRNQSWAKNARNMYDRSGRFAGPSGGDPDRAYRGSQKYRDALTTKWKQNQHSAAARQKHINKKGGTSLGYDMGQLKHAPRNIGTALKTAGSKVFGNNIEPKQDKLGNVKANKAGQTKYHKADPKKPGLLKRFFGSRTKNDSYSAFDDVLNQFGVSDLVNEKKK